MEKYIGYKNMFKKIALYHIVCSKKHLIIFKDELLSRKT